MSAVASHCSCWASFAAFNRTNILLPSGDGPLNHLRCNSHRSRHLGPLRVIGESKETKSSPDVVEALVDGMDFGELCNEFECLSSPAVESTARQLVRDILQMREGNRALGSYSVSVRYKDPIRTFTGREKYKRPLWATGALQNPSVISGQVIEHKEFWDLSSSPALAQSYFWISRRLFSAIESGKDTIDAAKGITSSLSTEKENMDVYPDPSGDPTKFFQRDDGLMRDAYQIALFLAVVYFVVQFLRTTL